MYNHNNKKKLSLSILLIIILVIGIGYAYLTSNLSITGATEVVANSWNIHFENLNVKEGSVSATSPATIQSNNVDITYSVTLARPKEYYEFTVDVKNDGTLPGKVSVSTLNGITDEASSVIDYTIRYINGNPVNIGDILNAGAKKTIRVRVFYKDDITSEDFPSNNLNLTLTFNLQYVQSEEDEFDTNALIKQLKTENSSCFTKYEGQVTDQPGQTVTASNVYINKCADSRYIKFAGFCWRMNRTTQTGGIKMVYYGEPVDGKCESTRGDHKGIVQSSYDDSVMNSSYLYGDSFTYDTTNNTFTLTNTFTETMSASTYENLLSKFTCKSNSDTCTTIYQINSPLNYYKTRAYLSYYTITDTNYAQIGTSSFNSNYRSPAMVGYMFNKIYYYDQPAPDSGMLTGNDVSYNNGLYTLLPAEGESVLGTTLDDTHHYSCNNDSGICEQVRYYYHSNDSFNSYYILLDGEANIEEAINNMFYADNVNRYNSSIKGIVDAWYGQNLSSKTSMLEDTVYCNARNITDLETNGWNKNGDLNELMHFKSLGYITDLSCLNITDQFAVSNNKAKLTYPVSLIRSEELYNIGNSSVELMNLIRTNAAYWTLSPNHYNTFLTYGNNSDKFGRMINSRIETAYGVRPTISLKNDVVISSGTGSEIDPWVVE